jgi:hypothetical protein
MEEYTDTPNAPRTASGQMKAMNDYADSMKVDDALRESFEQTFQSYLKNMNYPEDHVMLPLFRTMCLEFHREGARIAFREALNAFSDVNQKLRHFTFPSFG